MQSKGRFLSYSQTIKILYSVQLSSYTTHYFFIVTFPASVIQVYSFDARKNALFLSTAMLVRIKHV